MRCVYWPSISETDYEITIDGDEARHLIKVVRIKLNENILLNNGDGLGVIGKVIKIEKKSVDIEVINIKKEIKIERSIALCMVKKEALELSIRQATELGVNKIFLLNSQYSQENSLKADRLEKIIVSAMEQSNNLFYPEIINSELSAFVSSNKEDVLLFTSQSSTVDKNKIHQKMIPLIGPEGGFSDDELNLFKGTVSNHIHLPTPILRASTAVPTCIGYLLGATS